MGHLLRLVGSVLSAPALRMHKLLLEWHMTEECRLYIEYYTSCGFRGLNPCLGIL